MKPKVIFFGTPEFAGYILQYLVDNGVDVVCAVTVAPKEQGRGLKIRKTGTHEKADEFGIPVLTPDKLRDESFVNALAAYNADIFCVVAYRILPKEVYTLPKLGAFNVHTSLLPKYRGAAPMQRALMNGEKETGITTFLLEPTVDAGRILLQEKVAITENEDLGELHDDLMQLGAKLALDTINGFVNNTLVPRAQNDAEATPAPKILPADTFINFDRPAEAVHNQIRALSPIPGAVMMLAEFTLPNEEKLKIYKARVSGESVHNKPGVLLRDSHNKRLFVTTATQPLEILEVQREGKRKMTAEEFLRGVRFDIPILPE
ncbi:MAG TPA: methionyl-tRNA formyltransferase [Candidatus Kapabacteria bacterium]|nr:methionyl-tRNA formyltransferase [Candidatus Kapabacteria bacterium]